MKKRGIKKKVEFESELRTNGESGPDRVTDAQRQSLPPAAKGETTVSACAILSSDTELG